MDAQKKKIGSLFYVSNTNYVIYMEEKFEASIAVYPQIRNKKFTFTVTTSNCNNVTSAKVIVKKPRVQQLCFCGPAS